MKISLECPNDCEYKDFDYFMPDGTRIDYCILQGIIIFTNRKCPIKSVSITDHTLEKAMWSGITSLNICDFGDVRMRIRRMIK